MPLAHNPLSLFEVNGNAQLCDIYRTSRRSCERCEVIGGAGGSRGPRRWSEAFHPKSGVVFFSFLQHSIRIDFSVTT